MIITDELRLQWEKAAPNNKFIFAQLMQNEAICIGVLETFLQIEIDHIEYLKTEETIEETYFSKGIRVDVYVKDKIGSVYNVEMQRDNLGDLPKRGRYYQSLIDLNLLKKGVDYEKLGKSFVVFITNFDPFNKSHCVYDFENRDAANAELKLKDGTRKLFFNTRGKDKDKIDPRLRKILNFFDDKLPEKTTDDTLLQVMIDEFYRIKANKEMEVGFMTQAVYENDLKKMGYMDAESKFNPILEEKDAQLAEKDSTIAENKAQLAENKAQLAEKDDEIAQLKAMLREALAQLNQK